MHRFKFCALGLLVILLSGCASTKHSEYQNGDYSLVALNENAQRVNAVVTMSLADSVLYLAGPNNICSAPVQNDTIGRFSKVKQLQSNEMGTFAIMFLTTLEGATIKSAPDGFIWMTKNKRTVAIFEPLPPEVESPLLGQ